VPLAGHQQFIRKRCVAQHGLPYVQG